MQSITKFKNKSKAYQLTQLTLAHAQAKRNGNELLAYKLNLISLKVWG